jgi:hypothetical protein
MKCMAREKKPVRKFRRPTGLDELEIKFFIRSIEFIAHDRMT